MERGKQKGEEIQPPHHVPKALCLQGSVFMWDPSQGCPSIPPPNTTLTLSCSCSLPMGCAWGWAGVQEGICDPDFWGS